MSKRKAAGSGLPQVTESSARDANNGIARKAHGIAQPGSNDVLCGRGDTINRHPGNEQFRNVVESQRRLYLACQFKREKRLIAENIIRQIQSLSPPGRFLAKDARTGLWHEVDEEKARLKCSQALRERAKVIRAEMFPGTDANDGPDENEHSSRPQGPQESQKPATQLVQQQALGPVNPWEQHGNMYTAGYPVPPPGLVAMARPPYPPPSQNPSSMYPPYLVHGCIVMHPPLSAATATHANLPYYQIGDDSWTTNNQSREHQRLPLSSLPPSQSEQPQPPVVATQDYRLRPEAYRPLSPRKVSRSSPPARSSLPARSSPRAAYQGQPASPPQRTLQLEQLDLGRAHVTEMASEARGEPNIASQRSSHRGNYASTPIPQLSPSFQQGLSAAAVGASLTPRTRGSPFFEELQAMFFSNSPNNSPMGWALSPPEHPPPPPSVPNVGDRKQPPQTQRQFQLSPRQVQQPVLRQPQGSLSYSPLISRTSMAQGLPPGDSSQYARAAGGSNASATSSSPPSGGSSREFPQQIILDSSSLFLNNNNNNQEASSLMPPPRFKLRPSRRNSRTWSFDGPPGASLPPDISLALHPPPPLPDVRLSMRPSHPYYYCGNNSLSRSAAQGDDPASRRAPQEFQSGESGDTASVDDPSNTTTTDTSRSQENRDSNHYT